MIRTQHMDDYVATLSDPECRRRAYLSAAAVRLQFAAEAPGKSEKMEHLAHAAEYERRAAAPS